jgi:hypothetical protein
VFFDLFRCSAVERVEVERGRWLASGSCAGAREEQAEQAERGGYLHLRY